MGIRFKLILPMALMFVAFVVAMHFYWEPLQLKQAREDFIAQQKSELSVLQESLARYLLSGDLASLHSLLNYQLAQRSARWRDFIVYDARGQRVYPLRPHIRPSEPSPYAEHYTHPIMVGTSRIGEIKLTIDWQSRHDAIQTRVSQLEQFFLLIFAVAIMVSLIWQNILIRAPLARLEDAARQLTKSTFDTPLPEPGRDEIGSLTHSFITMRDALKRSQHELNRALQQAKESETRQRTIFNAMGDGLITMNSGGTITLCNPAALTIFDYTEKELLGAHIGNIIPTLATATLSAECSEQSGRNKQGERFPIYLNIREMTLSGDRHFGAIVHDISQQKAAQKELMLAHQKAEAASKAKSAFLATMSHEIRTPMNGVIGVVQLLESTPLNAEQREYIEIIDKSGTALLALINDILDLSKVESNKMEFQAATFNLKQTAEDIIQLFGNNAENKGLSLTLHYGENCPRYLVADAERIRQILLNLVSNAIKFTEHGYVTLRIDARSQTAQHASLDIVVEDSGIGIAPEVKKDLFNAFTQADSSTTRRFGGTGLGLAICKHFVELMGGEINVDSEPGKGACFRVTLTLPIASDADPAQSSDAPPPSRQTPLPTLPSFNARVLVVDDIRENRILIQTMLEQLGLTVECAHNGEEAIERWQTSDYDLILMDCQMPVMDGYQATTLIQQQARAQGRPNVNIIGFTAAAMSHDQDRCSAAGMVDTLVKPIKKEALIAMLQRWLNVTPPSAANRAHPG